MSWPRLERPVPPSFFSTSSSSSFFSLSSRVLSPWPLTRVREVINSRITHVTIPDTAMAVDRDAELSRHGMDICIKTEPGPVPLLLVQRSDSHEATNSVPSVLEIVFHDHKEYRCDEVYQGLPLSGREESYLLHRQTNLPVFLFFFRMYPFALHLLLARKIKDSRARASLKRDFFDRDPSFIKYSDSTR